MLYVGERDGQLPTRQPVLLRRGVPVRPPDPRPVQLGPVRSTTHAARSRRRPRRRPRSPAWTMQRTRMRRESGARGRGALLTPTATRSGSTAALSISPCFRDRCSVACGVCTATPTLPPPTDAPSAFPTAGPVVSNACACRGEWSTDDEGNCGRTQHGCSDVDCEGDAYERTWCVVVDRGCDEHQSSEGGGWACCTPTTRTPTVVPTTPAPTTAPTTVLTAAPT